MVKKSVKEAKATNLLAENLYCVLPLKDVVVFPNMIIPLFVGRAKSVRALDEVMNNHKKLLLVAQKESATEDPKPSDLYAVGTTATILQVLKLPDGTIKVLVEGHARAKILNMIDEKGYMEAECEEIAEKTPPLSDDVRELMTKALNAFDTYSKSHKKIPPEVHISLIKLDSLSKLSDAILAHITLRLSEKQDLLETMNPKQRMDKVILLMESEMNFMNIDRVVRNRVKNQMEKSQRDYYLNEQMKAIQKELGSSEDGRDEFQELEDKIEKVKLSKEAKEKALAELKKLKTMPAMSSEATVVRNYIDWLVSIPWKTTTKIKKDLKLAQKVLDADHHGLEKVKERIIEYLAVQNRVGKIKGPILCLFGPPGVGKTSLAKSIADATGRNFVRMSLGGIKDESEIRGHRRTYIGSMPGRIIQSMKKAKSSNPLILLDEIDKLSSDWRGDPSSALLEVLDPEQNNTFNDHYIEVDYDLSDVMFITTCNSLNMQQPLLDRMEIIRLSGYTEFEKLEIAKLHLIPKVFKNHGLKKGELTVGDDAILTLIRNYTREAGVRNLEKEISNLARKAVKNITLGVAKNIQISNENLEEYAGVKKVFYQESEQFDIVGVTTGLAWTEVGGDMLTIEANLVPGKGKLTITGKLGEVMQESAQAAYSFVRAQALNFGIEPPLFEKKDIHIHVPEGATPKDGPSAGVTMCTSLVSVLTGIPVRHDVAMTGEITLRGRVLPIGGLKEKLLAALRGGIKTVIIPKDNEKDLIEIPDNIKSGLTIIPVKEAEEVLKIALSKPLTPIEWDEAAYIKTQQMNNSSCGHCVDHV